jgi:glycosyltransferase involved in cell wall biosynthesis
LDGASSQKAGAVGIVVPLFNYAGYIGECLASVREQINAEELDVVVIDDYSADGSADAALQWLKGHGGVFNSWAVLQHEENRGLASARNTGVDHCQSSYYFPLDADNKLEKDCIAKCLARMRKIDGHKTIGAVYPSRLLFGDTTALFTTTNKLLDVGDWDPDRLAKGNYIDAMALVRKSAWRRVGGYTNVTERGGWQDYDFWCKFVECGLRALYEKPAVALYRTHENSMLHKRTHLTDVYPELVARIQEKHPWLALGPTESAR